jgi:hypothetical protein
MTSFCALQGRLQLLALVDRVRHLAGERSRIDLTGRRLNRAGPAKIHKLSLVPWELDLAHCAKIIADRIFTIERPGPESPTRFPEDRFCGAHLVRLFGD